MFPEFVIFTGPMFGGKTTRLLSVLERARYQKKKIILYKPKIDSRYSLDHVLTHSGLSWECKTIVTGDDILTNSKDYDIIAVDEAFLIQGLSQALLTLFKQGKTIYVSSIQLSAEGEPFDEIKEILPYATKIEICPAVCPITSQDAYYTIAKEKTEHFQVGGSETYEPRSFYYSKLYFKNKL